MASNPPTPIVVNGTVLPSTLAALLRYVIALGLSWLIERGVLPADSAEGILAIAITAATVAYGLYKTHKHKAQLVVTAEAAPNSVAMVRR